MPGWYRIGTGPAWPWWRPQAPIKPIARFDGGEEGILLLEGSKPALKLSRVVVGLLQGIEQTPEATEVPVDALAGQFGCGACPQDEAPVRRLRQQEFPSGLLEQALALGVSLASLRGRGLPVSYTHLTLPTILRV